MASISPIPPVAPVPCVVPAGRMARTPQPLLALPGGLELRPWHSRDAGVLVAAGQDSAIRKWNRLVVASSDDARRRIERMHERWRAEEAAIWAIARADTGEAVGLIGWGDIDLDDGNAEIVYWVLPAARGGGVVVEATKRLSRWALEDLGLHRLRLCHSTANPASCRVAEKAGYSFEGTQRSALLHEDGWHDEHLHSLVQGDI
ncbi:GNAT family N-acetyltransferase [Streptomyces sp. Agncl-13]|uniref:GNAT family N-acetyltransferase n=1 Tax=Streptomyces sp. Agncl-13 TaxID=3400628 RepID=UPI003A86AAC5